MHLVFKRIILFSTLTTTLYGCSVEETFEKGQDLLEKGEEVVNVASSKVNEVTSLFDGNIREIQNSNVYDEDYTFKELIATTVENPQWTSETDTYVTLQGKLKPTSVDLAQYNGLEEIILDFPFDEGSGISLANAGVFTTIDGGAIIDGTAYELSGDEIIGILNIIYETN